MHKTMFSGNKRVPAVLRREGRSRSLHCTSLDQVQNKGCTKLQPQTRQAFDSINARHLIKITHFAHL